jgi:hypothetical protein
MPASIVVGDLHGKIEIAEYWIKNKEHRNLIFIGDYLDSFDRSIEDQYELLEMVLDAAENMENVSALMGNHELSYLDERYKASGFEYALDAKITHLKSKMWKLLKLYHIDNGFLISHAGFSRSFMGTKFSKAPQERKLELIEEAISELSNEQLYQIGYSRGGNAKCGGPIWCDWYDEFRDISNIRQVVGHTARRKQRDNSGVVRKGGSVLIDCLDRKNEVLWISHGKARKKGFELPKRIIV